MNKTQEEQLLYDLLNRDPLYWNQKGNTTLVTLGSLFAEGIDFTRGSKGLANLLSVNDSKTLSISKIIGGSVSGTQLLSPIYNLRLGDWGQDQHMGDSKENFLWGGAENDKLLGQKGNDLLDGSQGHDTLIGGAGQDILLGGLGDDIIYGQNGDDTLIGQEGLDTIIAGSGSDYLDGGDHSDRLLGKRGHDRILGGDGDDTMSGHHDNDTLEGGNGDDRLYGGRGNDSIDGGKGNDLLFGGHGDDSLIGAGGDDTLKGHAGNDLLLSQSWTARGFNFIHTLPVNRGQNTPLIESIPKNQGLKFRSGFELGSTPIYRNGRLIDIKGQDQSFQSANDWDQDLKDFWINYVDYDKGGPNPDMLGADIVTDPDNPDNKVFYSWQKDAEKQDDGPYSRIQGELNDINWPEVYYKVRFRLGGDISSVDPYSKSDAGLSLIEFVTGNSNDKRLVRLILHKWGGDRSFSNGEAPLEWRAEVLNWSDKGGHELFKPSGLSPNYDQWQTLEFYVKSGGPQTGRFWVRLNESQVIFDETVATKNQDAKLDIQRISLLKSYGGNLVKAVQANDGQVDVWYDDLEIWNSLPTDIARELGEYHPSHQPSAGESLIDLYQKFQAHTVELKSEMVETQDQTYLYGGSGADTLVADAGHDLLHGGSDNDILKAGLGNDTLVAGSGNDILIGDAGNDRLTAVSGINLLVGGDGDDTLIGGRGADLFLFKENFGFDQLRNFASGIDKIDIRNTSFGIDELDSNLDGQIDDHDMNVSLHKGSLHISFQDQAHSQLLIQTSSRLAVSDFLTHDSITQPSK